MADYDLGTARGKIDIDASGAKKGVDDAAKSTDNLGKSTGEMSQASKTAGLALTGFGLAAIAAFGVAVKASADFEKQMSAFKAVSGATTEQMDAIREKALQLGADTKFSASEAAGAMEELAKQGLSVSDIMNGAADATVNLAAAGEIDLTQAASIAAAALNQFKLNAQDLPHVADLLAGAANASATGVSEIGSALTFVGSVAKTVGLSIDDTAASIALLANNGIDASKAGTVLRSILTDLSPTTNKAKNAMRDLGIITKDGKNQFFDASGKVKTMSEVIDILNKSTSGLTSQQKINTLQMIFGTEALAGISAMAGTTKEEFDKLQSAIGNVSAQDVAATRMDNLAGAVEELSGSFDTLLIKAGSQFQVGLTGVVKALTGVLNFITKLNPEIQKWVGIAVAAAGAAALFVGGLILFVGALEKAKVAFAALNFVISNNPIVRTILIIAAIVAAIITAYKTVDVFRNAVDKLWERFQPVWDGIKEKAGEVANFFSNTVLPKIQNAWNSLIDTAQRIGDAIVAAVGPKVLEAWQKLQEVGGTVADFFRNTVAPKLAEVWESIRTGAANIAGGIGPALLGAFDTVKGKAQEVQTWFVTTFGPGFATVWQQIQDGAAGLRDWFQNDFVTGLRGIFTEKVQPAWQGFLTWVETTLKPALVSLGTDIQTSLGTAVDTVKAKIAEIGQSAASGDLGEGIKERITTAWNAIIAFFSTTVLPAIQSFVALAIEQWNQFASWMEVNVKPIIIALGELWTAIWNKMNEIVPPVLEQIKTVIGIFIAGVVIFWQAFGDNIINSWLIVWDGVKGILEGFLQIIRGVINLATAIISGDWGKAWEGIVNILQGAWNVMWAIVSTVAELIWNFIQAAFTGIWRIIQMVWSAIVDKTVETWNSFKNAVTEGVNNAWETVRSLPGKIIDALSHIDLFGIGARILGSLIDGIKSKIGELASLLGKITDMIPIKKGPPEKDKKLLVENGQLIMEGLVAGLTDGWKAAQNLLSGMTNEISPSVGTTNNNNQTVVNVNFGDVHGAGGQAIAASLGDPNLLRQITNAARAGVGGGRL
jgi:TP901 family phage tail tape measure protein